jgi:signal transduction histidine kinase
MTGRDLREQLASLHAISVEIAALHEISEIHERALDFCRELTDSALAFTGLVVHGTGVMDVAAIRGFEPTTDDFYEDFHLMALRSSVVGVTIKEERPSIANDVVHDPLSVGVPPGHPAIYNFLGVPLRVGPDVIGMIGVANSAAGYGPDDERLLGTFANDVAVAIDNARLYQRQQEMIDSLQQLHERLSEVERSQLLARERERIAGRLHDHIEQQIFSIGLRINALIEGNEGDARVVASLRTIRQQTIDMADQVRQTIFALGVPGQGDEGLIRVVQSLLRDLERRAGLATQLVADGAIPSGLEQIQDVLFAVIQEALSNVERHARARTALVSVRAGSQEIVVVIQDDGVGVPALILDSFESSYLHYGLRHMRQQIVAIGGSFQVTTGEEGGAVVRIIVPIAGDDA